MIIKFCHVNGFQQIFLLRKKNYYFFKPIPRLVINQFVFLANIMNTLVYLKLKFIIYWVNNEIDIKSNL